MTQRGGRDILAAVLVVDITTWVGEEPLEPGTWAQEKSSEDGLGLEEERDQWH